MAKARTLGELERMLKALASVNRLRLLESLHSPKGYADLALSPTREDEWGSPDRPITRQAIRHHLRGLRDIGVVADAPPGPGGEAQFVVHHARLFAVVEELRQLATIRSAMEVAGHTMALEHRTVGGTITGPHLALVRGVEEGRAFPLDAPDRDGGWTIGRKREASISLDYDPYVSSEHARIVRRGEDYFLMDLAFNKNGTYLNWQRMIESGVAALKPGDVIGVGMSLLVFRA